MIHSEEFMPRDQSDIHRKAVLKCKVGDEVVLLPAKEVEKLEDLAGDVDIPLEVAVVVDKPTSGHAIIETKEQEFYTLKYADIDGLNFYRGSENKVAGYYLFPNEEFMVVIEEEEE